MDSRTLLDSSQRWLTAGLSAFSRDDGPNDFAVHHAGVGMEHLMKAYLASLHPALVADPKDFEALLHATGHGNHPQIKPANRTKTIGLNEAFARVKKVLGPAIPVKATEFDPVITARNGVAHAGRFDATHTREVLTTCIRLAEPLLTELKVFSDEFWGDHRVLRDQLLNKHATHLQLAYAAKLARAREQFEKWSAGIAGESLVDAITALEFEAPYPLSPAWSHRVESCPGCGWRGWLSGDIDLRWRTDRPNEPYLVVIFTAYQCAICKLRLEGEELTLAGLDTEKELDEDPWEYLQPDADLYRDQ